MAGSDLLLKDANLYVSVNIPAASANVYTPAIDINNRRLGQFAPERTEFSVDLPALSVAQLGNGFTVTYEVYTSDTATPGSGSPVLRQSFVQTGAGGAGAAAVTKSFTLPLSAERYVYVKVLAGASSAATAAVVAFYMVF
jgi:hypothetical protein